MRVPRFFVDPALIVDATVVLEGDQAVHAQRVLRLGPGDKISILDGRGFEYDAVIAAIDGDGLRCNVVERRERSTEPSLRVTLGQGIPKGDKFETIVQKATELGVSRVVPIRMRRSVVLLDKEKGRQRVERWQRVAREAAQQAGRSLVPVIAEPEGLDGLLKEWNGRGPILVLWEGEATTGLRETCEGLFAAGGCDEVLLIIGPEGGIDAEEIGLVRESRGITVSFGPRILRTETAGPAALTAVLLLHGDMG